jgi:hypothetical protein
VVKELNEMPPARTVEPNVDPEAKPQTGEPHRLSNVLIEHVKAMTDSTLNGITQYSVSKMLPN